MWKKTIKRGILNFLPFFYKKLQKSHFLPKYMIFAIDIFLVLLSFTLAHAIRYMLLDDASAADYFLKKILICMVIAGFFFFVFNTYAEFIRFSSFRNIMRVILSLFCTHICLLVLSIFFPKISHFSNFTQVGLIISFLLSVCIILFSRIMVRLVYDFVINSIVNRKGIPLLIYGIDAVHIGLANVIQIDEKFPYVVAGFIAPTPLSPRHQILGNRVYAPEDIFNGVITSKGIKTVLVRAKDLQSEKGRALFRRFTKYKIDILSMPAIENLNDIRKVRKINIEDLLGRNPIKTDIASIGKNMKGKTVLVTGAAGSIGSEIVRQLSCFNLEKLLLVDMAESPLHQLSLELNDITLIPFVTYIADIRNKTRMKYIFEKYKPHYIYHAAAYKHVPLMEQHPGEAILTNVMGTKIVADLAIEYHAECFVMISTDKAVNPSNVMGASKRIAEMYIQSLSTALKKNNRPDNTQLRFITTRFGNVLGSNGSVIPHFAKQISEGGPITVTHPDIIRYFMTIPEACSLVLEAGNLGKGGEVFVFDMGKSVRIKDLAEEMIRLSGLEPYIDIDIVYTGLRPGEKLHEELLYDKEQMETLQNEKIMIGNVCECDYQEITAWIEKLRQAAETYDDEAIVKIMKEMVPEFVSKNSDFEVLDK